MDARGAAGAGTVPGRDHEAVERHWWAGHEDALPEGLEWLSARERARCDAMRFTKRRNEYLLRRWVGKRTVAARVGLDTDPAALARIEVLNRMTGAPYIVIEGALAPWDISLSDRAGCAVAVIGGAAAGRGPGDLGHRPRGRRATQRGVRDRLPDARRAGVGAGAAAAEDPRLGHDAAANLVWSAKESALKVLRVGLRADTRSVEVTVRVPATRRRVGSVHRGPARRPGTSRVVAPRRGLPPHRRGRPGRPRPSDDASPGPTDMALADPGAQLGRPARSWRATSRRRSRPGTAPRSPGQPEERAMPRSSASTTYGPQRRRRDDPVDRADPQSAFDGVDGVELVGDVVQLLRADLLDDPGRPGPEGRRLRSARRGGLRAGALDPAGRARRAACTSRANTVAAAGAPPMTDAKDPSTAAISMVSVRALENTTNAPPW